MRPTSSLVSFGVAVALAAFLFGEAAIRGSWTTVARWLPLALFVLWMLWLVLWRSQIRVRKDRIVVTNLARISDVPWARVSGVAHGPQVVLELDDGSLLSCWGGPFPSRRGGGGVDALSPIVLYLDRTREAAHAALDTATARDEPVRRRWDTPVLAIGGVLLIAAIAAPFVVTG